VPDGERAFYSAKTYDIEYEFPFGIQELEGIAYRTDYDLTCISRAPASRWTISTRRRKERLVPHVVEPSAGCDRTVLALICEAYDEETVTDEKGKSETRIVMRFAPRMAPVKAGVFPLLKNKPELVAKAREVQKPAAALPECLLRRSGRHRPPLPPPGRRSARPTASPSISTRSAKTARNQGHRHRARARQHEPGTHENRRPAPVPAQQDPLI
jgi:glycyl-tRNA synthetase (class II)